MMKRKGRYKVIKTDKGYTIRDSDYPYIGYQLFSTKAEAESYRAGLYGLTVKEYREWKANERKETLRV